MKAWSFRNKEGKTSFIYLVSTNQIIVHLFTECTKLFVICDSLAFCLGMRHFVSMKNLKYFTKIKMKFKFQ